MTTRRELLKLVYPTAEEFDVSQTESRLADYKEFAIEEVHFDRVYNLGFESGVLTVLSLLKDKVEIK